MRLALLLSVALVTAGCGQAGGEAPGAGTAVSGTATLERSKGSEPPASATRPPPIVLVSEAGQQAAVIGSFCVDNPEAGVGVCSDGIAPRPKEMTVVRPGDEVVIRLVGARATRSADCHMRDSSCIGEAHVTPLGCPEQQPLVRIFLDRGAETTWRVALEPGEYELPVFVYFETDDGRSGDVSGVLGLRVDPEASPEVVPANAERGSCR
jgi:hypothetical protein